MVLGIWATKLFEMKWELNSNSYIASTGRVWWSGKKWAITLDFPTNEELCKINVQGLRWIPKSSRISWEENLLNGCLGSASSVGGL